MSGLVGVWHFDDRPVDRTLLASLASTIAHRGGDHVGVWTSPHVGLACQMRRVRPESDGECQPLIDAAGRALLFDGRLDNRDVLLGAMADVDLSPDSPDATVALAAYCRWGQSFLERLAGDFALVLFDPRERTLWLARDAVGCRPLYYWTDRRTLVVASEIKAILAHPDVPARPNDDLLADSLLLDRLPYDDEGETFFESILAVRPGHWLRAGPAQIETGQFWDFDPCAQIRYSSRSDYADHLRELIVTAVRQRMRSLHPVAVAASGGLDSSAVLCIADDLRRNGAAGTPLLPLTATPPGAHSKDDTQFLSLLESSRGLSIECIPMGVPGEVEQIALAAWHSESPVYDDGWLSLRPMVAHARARGARIMLTGLWSDQLLFETGYLADLFLRPAWRTVARHLDEYPRWFVGAEQAYFRSRFRHELASYLAPDALRDVVRAVRSRRAVPQQHPSLVQRDWAARLKRRQRRAAHPRFGSAHARCLYEAVRAKSRRLQFELDEKLMAGCGIETATPFLDRAVIAFLMAIPGEIQNRDGVPRMILREAMRGLVPDPILVRRWRDEEAAGSTDDSARIGLESWRRCFFMD